MRSLLAFAAGFLLVAGCEKEEPRYPETKFYPETTNATPPPPTTTTPRPPIHAEPNVPPQEAAKPGQEGQKRADQK
jgi:hypothetical protein